jgi:hypothetical protein
LNSNFLEMAKRQIDNLTELKRNIKSLSSKY